MEATGQTMEAPPSSKEGERLSVLLEDPDSADAGRVGEALTAVLGLPRADATRRARYSHGVLLTNADADTARRLLVQLDQRGIPALSIPAAAWQVVPLETRIRELRIQPAFLSAHPRDPSPRLEIEWARIEAISIHATLEMVEAKERYDKIMHAVAERSLRPGLVRVLDAIQEQRGKGVEVHIGADFICPSADRLLRIDRDCIITGEREEKPDVHSMERYLRFLDEAIARSGAYLTGASLSFLEELQVRSILLGQEEERREIHIWLWQMSAAGRLVGRG